MRKLKIYIETSTWNFYFADDAPEKKEVTRRFFQRIQDGIFNVYISEVVLYEINNASEKKKNILNQLIDKCHPEQIQINNEMEDLAGAFIARRIIPSSKREDALHVAAAVVAELDAVITWNYKHLANLRRAELFHSVSLEKGFLKKVEILTPMEVSYG